MRKQFAGLIGLVLFASLAGVGLKAAGAPPNVEMLMPFVLAAGLVGGPVYGFTVGLAVRATYDVYQGWMGPWTLLTAPSYAVVGLLVGLAGNRWKSWNRTRMMMLAGVVTLVYDILTMLLFGIPFGIPFWALVAGQIPFSISHVIGNMLFCFLFAPSAAGVLHELVFVGKDASAAVVKA